MTSGFGPGAPVRREECRQLANAAGRAFHDDPIWEWIYPDPAARTTRLPRLFLRFIHHARRRSDTISTSPGLGGVAIWRPPGQWRETRWSQLRLGLSMAPLFLGVTDRMVALGKTVESMHPDEPHWYLALLATDPPAQGRGIGSALLGEKLAECDAQGIPVYLETETAANVAFYARHGFTIRDEVDVPRAGPHMWFMWREPR